MHILVTGAAGFIGSHMAERLQALGYNVTGIDNFSDYYSVELKHENADVLKAKGIKILNLDLAQADTFKKLPQDIDYIFHFAAQPGIAADSTFEQYKVNNFEATNNLVEFATSLPALKMFVNISTSSVYGVNATYSEEKETKPVSFYGVTKLGAEQLVLAKARLGLLPACSFRLFSVYGPRERPDKLFTKLIDAATNDKDFPLYEGSLGHLRSFTYVGDIIDGIQSVIGKEGICNNEIFNIGTEAEYTTSEGIKTVERLTNSVIRIKHLPRRRGDQEHTNANIDKARKLLNYNPSTTLVEGVKKQIEWFHQLKLNETPQQFKS